MIPGRSVTYRRNTVLAELSGREAEAEQRLQIATRGLAADRVNLEAASAALKAEHRDCSEAEKRIATTRSETAALQVSVGQQEGLHQRALSALPVAVVGPTHYTAQRASMQ